METEDEPAIRGLLVLAGALRKRGTIEEANVADVLAEITRGMDDDARTPIEGMARALMLLPPHP